MNKDFYKSLVAVANPDAKVSFDPKKADPRKPVGRPSDDMREDRDQLRVQMLNQAYGFTDQAVVKAEAPPRVNSKTITKNLVKESLVKQAVAAGGPIVEIPTAPVAAKPVTFAAVPTSAIDTLTDLVRGFAKGLKEGIGGQSQIITEPSQYGWKVSMSHTVYTNLSESKAIPAPIIEIKCQINPSSFASRTEVILAVEEGTATKQGIVREYANAKNQLEDFNDLIELAMKL